MAAVGQVLTSQSREDWHRGLAVESHIRDTRRGRVGHRAHLVARARCQGVLGHEVPRLTPDVTSLVRD